MFNRYFNDKHPVAEVASRICERRHDLQPGALLSGIACGECWEQAIRNDERVATEHELPPAPRDPNLIDEVAVRRAIHGEPVELTPAELRAVVRRLRKLGNSVTRIATRMRMNNRTVIALLQTSTCQRDCNSKTIATANQFHRAAEAVAS